MDFGHRANASHLDFLAVTPPNGFNPLVSDKSSRDAPILEISNLEIFSYRAGTEALNKRSDNKLRVH